MACHTEHITPNAHVLIHSTTYDYIQQTLEEPEHSPVHPAHYLFQFPLPPFPSGYKAAYIAL